MNAQSNNKMNIVKNVISQVAGIAVDFTIRGEKSFTFHFEGKNETAMNRIAKYFRSANAQVEAEYDVECDYTMVFVEA
jgi:hypothetical protein